VNQCREAIKMGGVARYHVDRRSFLPGDVVIIPWRGLVINVIGDD